MRKIIIVLLCFMGLASTASASVIEDIRLHVGSYVSDPFDTFAFRDNKALVTDAPSADAVGVGTTFELIGHGVVTDLRSGNTIVDTPGLGTDYDLWFTWEASGTFVQDYGVLLVGNVTSLRVTLYEASTDWSFASDLSPEDDVLPSELKEIFSISRAGEGSVLYMAKDGKQDYTLLPGGFSVTSGYLISDSLGDLSDLRLHGYLTESTPSGLTRWDDGTLVSAGSGSITVATPTPATGLLVAACLALVAVGRRGKKDG